MHTAGTYCSIQLLCAKMLSLLRASPEQKQSCHKGSTPNSAHIILRCSALGGNRYYTFHTADADCPWEAKLVYWLLHLKATAVAGSLWHTYCQALPSQQDTLSFFCYSEQQAELLQLSTWKVSPHVGTPCPLLQEQYTAALTSNMWRPKVCQRICLSISKCRTALSLLHVALQASPMQQQL